MNLNNEDTLLGLAIGAIIVGLGISMLFMRGYVGDGAVVLAIGLMTLALVTAVRSEKVVPAGSDVMLPEPTKSISIDLTQTEPITQPSQNVENLQAQGTQNVDVTLSEPSEGPTATEATQQSQQSSEEPRKEEPIEATAS